MVASAAITSTVLLVFQSGFRYTSYCRHLL